MRPKSNALPGKAAAPDFGHTQEIGYHGMNALLVGLPPQFGKVLRSLDAEIHVHSIRQRAAAFPLLRWSVYDLVLLSLDLFELDAFRLISRWRANKLGLPLVAITRQTHPSQKVRALNHGADDLIVWPVDGRELRARISGVLDRSPVPKRDPIQIGRLAIDTEASSGCVRGKVVRLTRTELEIFHFLAGQHGKVVSKEAIYSHIYGLDGGPALSAIEARICGIRRKFLAAGEHGLIRTVLRSGYILLPGASDDMTIAEDCDEVTLPTPAKSGSRNLDLSSRPPPLIDGAGGRTSC